MKYHNIQKKTKIINGEEDPRPMKLSRDICQCKLLLCVINNLPKKWWKSAANFSPTGVSVKHYLVTLSIESEALEPQGYVCFH